MMTVFLLVGVLCGVLATNARGFELGLHAQPSSANGNESPLATGRIVESGSPDIEPGDDVWIDVSILIDEPARSVYLQFEWDDSWEFVDWRAAALPRLLSVKSPTDATGTLLVFFDPLAASQEIAVGSIRMIVGDEGTSFGVVSPPGEEGIVVALGPYDELVLPLDQGASRGIVAGDSGHIRIGAVAPTSLALSCSPNPTAGSMSIQLETPVGGKAEFSLFDVAGRQVLKLPATDVAAGRNRIGWDGRSSRGAFVNPGVYFLHVAVANRDVYQRIVIVK